MEYLEIIIVSLIVGGSAFWAIRKISKTLFKKKDDCSTCKGCALAKECTSDQKTV